ncbi:flippase [Tenacibaculum sp. TC6]
MIRKNFIYNNLLGFTNVLTPLIIFPYISRTIEPQGVGIVSFAISLTSIFVILGSLGIPIYGIREIAVSKDSEEKLSKTFSEIFIIQLYWLLVILIFYSIWIYFSGTFSYNPFLKVASYLYIIALTGTVNWFFQGIENYRLLAQLNIISKIIMIALVFLLIKSKEDYWLYYCVIVLTLLLNAFFILLKVFRIVKFSFKNLNLKRHIKGIGILFSTQIAIGIYINLDIIFLNYFSNTTEVGFYSAANKVIKIFLLIITSLSTVLIPKISQYIEKNRKEEAILTIEKSMNFILFLGCPSIVLITMLAPEIIYVFAGDEFRFSSLLVQFLVPLLLLIGLSNIFGLQILVPFREEKKLMFAVLLGAIVSILLNVTLVPRWYSFGTTFALLFTELVITVLTFFYAKKIIDFNMPIKLFLKYLVGSLIFIPIYFLFKIFFKQEALLLATGITSLSVYFSVLYLVKDPFFIKSFLNPVLKKIK